MKQYGKASPRQRGERGQVLILAVVALILVVMAILLLFDVQTIIRGKVKAQNGVDAAALTGAEWQKHSLNLIGELNLVRAAGTLISDPFFAKGIMNDPNSNASEFFADIQPVDPEEFTRFPEKREFYNEDGSVDYEKLVLAIIRVEKQKRYLDALNKLVSQLQTRIAFVGPLIGFGAAQQAAKNNGITSNRRAAEFYTLYMNFVGDNGIYEQHTPVFIHDYPWRTPYLYMLGSILDYSMQRNEFSDRTENKSYGIAVGTTIQFVGMPSLSSNPPSEFSRLLGNKAFYDSILSRNWCELDELLHMDFSGNWWGNFECDFDDNFSGQSEILPLHIAFSESMNPYQNATDAKVLDKYLRSNQRLFSEMFNREEPYQYTVDDDVVKSEEIEGQNHKYYTYTKIAITIDQPLETYNDQDADRRYDLLPRLSWATFDQDWGSYSREMKEWAEKFLRKPFKAGLDYRSGAYAYFESMQNTVTLTGSPERIRGDNEEKAVVRQDVGQVFASTETNWEAQRVSGNLNRLRDSRNIEGIRAIAEAKPLGRIRTNDGQYIRPFEAGRMVMPVFTETALIPITLEPPGGMSMLDIDWYYYLTEFVPILANSDSLDDAWVEAGRNYPHHMGYFSRYVNALRLIGNSDFRQMGINWLRSPIQWEKDANGNRYPVRFNRDNCYGNGEGESSLILH